MAVPDPPVDRKSWRLELNSIRAWAPFAVPAFGTILTVALILVPLITLLLFSFRLGTPWDPGPFTLRNYEAAYGDSQIYLMFARTIVFALLSTIVSVVLAVMLAYMTERTDMPFRNVAWAATLLPMAIPGLLFAMSWTYLLSPKIGLYNLWLRDLLEPFGVEFDVGPFDIYSFTGMIFVEGLRGVATNYLIVVGAFRNMDPAFEEAARMSGCSSLTAFRRIFLPLMTPIILAAGIYSFMTHLESLEIPLVIGFPSKIYVFPSYIYFTTQRLTPPQFGLSAALGVTFLIVSILLVIGYRRIQGANTRFATVTGKSFRPNRIKLGAWRWPSLVAFLAYLLITVGGPGLILIWTSMVPFYAPPGLDMLGDLSFVHYFRVLQEPKVRGAILNTLAVATIAASLTMALSVAAAWVIVRSRHRARSALDALVFVPHALPGVIIGISIMLVFIQPPLSQFGLFGTAGLVAVGLTVAYISFGSRTMVGALTQLHQDIEEAASVAGASWSQIMMRIILPLLATSFISGWIWVASQSMRNLSIPLMLSTRDSEVLSVVMWQKWGDGYPGQTAALGMMLILALAVIAVIGRFIAIRRA